MQAPMPLLKTHPKYADRPFTSASDQNNLIIHKYTIPQDIPQTSNKEPQHSLTSQNYYMSLILIPRLGPCNRRYKGKAMIILLTVKAWAKTRYIER
jgi:hypothetical protein